MPSADPPSDAPSTLAAKPFSISLGASKSKPSKPNHSSSSPSKPLNPKKRPHSSLNDDSDSDSALNGHSQPVPQLVSAFDRSAGGAIALNGNENANEPLVIQGLKNRNWREESRRKRGKKNLLPAEVQAQRAAQPNGIHAQGGHVERDEVGKASGLSFVVQKEDDGGDVVMREGVTADDVEDAKPKTADEEALEALLGGQLNKSTLVVPAVEAEGEEDLEQHPADMNDDDRFRSDVSSRPDSASLDDYARVPVEEFGMGMLRGMGWKEGEVVGKRKNQVSKPRVVERRPALLGIGAKEVPGGVGDELGAWGKEVRGKRKVDKMYNPVLLKNSKTGEMLTEEELQAKKEKHKEAEKEWRDRRDRNLAVDEEKKSGRKRQQLAMGYDDDGASRSGRRERSRSRESRYSSSGRQRSRSAGRKHGSSKRERSKSRERRHHSRRRDHDEDEPRHPDRRRDGRLDRDDSRSSSYSHRSRDDDTRRRRHDEY
ncbi:DNA primase large subunit Spp2 [Xanthoria calcicola]